MTPPDDRDPVDVLAEEFAERMRRGERPSVGDYATAHPELADALRELLPAVAQMEQLKRFRQAAPAGKRPLPDRLGDFRIVRELGRGGMGVVFEAVQESLGRRVALKVLSAHAQLDPGRRERFVREAKAAARLHHTNVVPVFGVGEQDGLPYYVMQLIPGCGLHEVVTGWRRGAADTADPLAAGASTVEFGPPREAPAPSRTTRDGAEEPPAGGPRCGDWAFVAGVGIQVAEALQYAHEQGVLHRDVKPANLLLDGRGRVWVADFGLAKLVDHHGLTATGHVLGTLQYLAPECLHGRADARSDVYGLGATLYELLTLAPPFPADNPARLMKQLAESDPPPPRALNPAVPRDLETIVLKALAREPDRRYASAELLADDLRAFLDDRPIRARRETWAGRGWRWCRRNPAVAVLSASTVAALVLAAAVGWVGYARTTAALEAEAKKRDEAEQVSTKLEANLRLSLAAFEQVFEAAGGDEFRPAFGPRPGGGFAGGPEGRPGGPFVAVPFPGEAADRAGVLEAVLAFYDRFAEQNATNPRLRFEAAKAHRRVGEMHRWLGRQEKAAASFRRALGLLDGLAEEYPGGDDIRFERMLALAQTPAGSDGAEQQLARAAELGRGFTTPPRRWAAAGVSVKLGWAREQAGNRAGAEAAYREAIDLLAPDPDGMPRPPHVVVEHVTARRQLAALLAADGNLRDARRILEAITAELRQSVASGQPQARFLREPFAATHHQLADVLDQLGERVEAGRVRAEAERVRTSGPPGGPFPPGGSAGRPVPPKEPPPPPRR